jgi:aminoglycoside 3-N-acetyltransferase
MEPTTRKSSDVARRDIGLAEFEQELRGLGVRAGSVLVVHTSYRAVGPVEGGLAGLIAALRSVLGPDGTLVMPAMSASRRPDPFDPATSPTWHMGVVSETFWRMPGVLRSEHPTSSFAALGPHAGEITAPQSLSPISGLDSPIGRVYQLGGTTLLLGVDHDKNTLIHVAEAIADVPYRRRATAHVLRDGQPGYVEYEETETCTRNFVQVDQWLREAKLQSEGTVGHAHARLVDARDAVEITVGKLREDPLVFLCPPARKCEQCEEARASLSASAHDS